LNNFPIPDNCFTDLEKQRYREWSEISNKWKIVKIFIFSFF